MKEYNNDRLPRIAVVCSGLGHVFRGVETWAFDLAQALNKSGYPATLFQGSGEQREPWQRVLHSTKRTDARAERLAGRLVRLGGWKYGLGSGYQLEQTSFALKLWPQLQRDYDIVHTQDPWVGLHLERLRRLKLSRPHVILAHGTEEPTEYLQQFANLQHLAPCYLDTWKPYQPAGQQAFGIGNFVKTDLFCPGDVRSGRAKWDLPEEALIVLSVAAIKKHHKRIDYLISEFAAFARQFDKQQGAENNRKGDRADKNRVDRENRAGSGPSAVLVIAGGQEPETEEVMAMGRELLGDRVRFLTNVSRDRMPSLYHTADIFALASLHEMMPIALLEALASGLPILCNDTPTLRWMAGAGGQPTDISQPGALALQLARLADPTLRRQLAQQARAHAENTFAEQVVVDEIKEMYAMIFSSTKNNAARRAGKHSGGHVEATEDVNTKRDVNAGVSRL